MGGRLCKPNLYLLTFFMMQSHPTRTTDDFWLLLAEPTSVNHGGLFGLGWRRPIVLYVAAANRGIGVLYWL